MTAARDSGGRSAQRRSTPAILALSDDLTGAAAVTAELHAAGLRAAVATWAHASRRPSAAQALVLDTGTRALPAARARERVAALAQQLPAPTAGWYKRVDSALRGNVGDELAALAGALGRPLVVAAAAPSLGITTGGGVQRLGDAPVDRTHFALGADGARSARVASLLPGAVEVPLAVVRGDVLGETLVHHAAAGRHAVCDAVTAADLDRIARALAGPALRDRVVPVGSYGLARPWAVALGLPAGLPGRPVLAAVSSLKPASREQVDVAAAGGAHVIFEAAHGELAPAAASLAAGRDVVLVAASAAGAPACPGAATAAELARRLTRMASASATAGLIVVGGDLASAFLQSAGASASVVAAPWPATPVMSLVGGPLDGRLAVFKSGAQGGPDWLDHATGLVRSMGVCRAG